MDLTVQALNLTSLNNGRVCPSPHKNNIVDISNQFYAASLHL